MDALVWRRGAGQAPLHAAPPGLAVYLPGVHLLAVLTPPVPLLASLNCNQQNDPQVQCNAPTDIPGCGAHGGLHLEPSLDLIRGGDVEYPVVVDQSHQRPRLQQHHQLGTVEASAADD